MMYIMNRKKFHIKINVLILLIISIFLLTYIHYIRSARCSLDKQSEQIKSKYRLVIVILTNPDNMRQRNVIRKSWLSKRHDNVKHFFAIGTLDMQPEQRDTLKSEKDKYHDLLLLPKLQDSYDTLTKKVLYSFRQIYENYEFDFLVKCDDDSLVLVDRVLKELDKRQNKGTRRELYWGFFNGKAQVKKRGPWKETDWILCDYYLPYALGGGYVLSFNLVEFIAKNSDILKIYHSEDVSVGLWLAPLANIERKHDVRFDTLYRSRGCSNEYIITHKKSIDNIDNMYQLYEATGALCIKEVKNHMSYQYNWTVPPSQCCYPREDIP